MNAKRWMAMGIWALALGMAAGPAGAQYTKTKYPIVLVHGLLGFNKMFGFMEYWYGIPGALRADGATVFVTQASQLNTSEARGEQIIAQLLQWRAITGAQKFNLIGHSQGAIDIRYVAAVRPDLVASVTSVAGPHKGNDLANAAPDLGAASELIASFMEALGDVIALFSASPYPNDGLAAIRQLSSNEMAKFNAKYPKGLPSTACGQGASIVNGVRYYSWSGVGTVTTGIDITDPLMALTQFLNTEPNDGLVGRCSSHLGTVLRDNYFHNHLDEVNQMLGLVPIFEANPKAIVRAHANRLRNLGL